MEINHRSKNGITIIDMGTEDGALVPGDIDEFFKRLISIIPEKSTKLALDMSEKKYLNSWGLGQLIKLKDNLVDYNINLYLLNLSGRVVSLLNIAGVDGFFRTVSSENEIK